MVIGLYRPIYNDWNLDNWLSSDKLCLGSSIKTTPTLNCEVLSSLYWSYFCRARFFWARRLPTIWRLKQGPAVRRCQSAAVVSWLTGVFYFSSFLITVSSDDSCNHHRVYRNKEGFSFPTKGLSIVGLSWSEEGVRWSFKLKSLNCWLSGQITR